MISPLSVTGTTTTDGGWRTTSAFSVCPLGRSTVSTLTLKMRPVNTFWISRATIGLLMWSAPLILFLRGPARKIVEHRLQILGQPGDEFHPPLVARMLENQSRGVQEWPFEPLHRAYVAGDT